MRQSVLKTFNEICLFNLHGDSNVGDNIPEGFEDENVFDIQQGVGISIMKRTLEHQTSLVNYDDIWGRRVQKYDKLQAKQLHSRTTSKLSPNSPLYLLLPSDENLRTEFESAELLPDIMPFSTSGIVTSKDGLVIGFNDKEIKSRISIFLNHSITDRQVKSKLDLSENYSWRVSEARKELVSDPNWIKQFKTIHYRPFDNRRILYHPAVVWRTRETKMLPMIKLKNIGLLATRQSSRAFTHISCTRHIVEMKCCSHDRNTELFPLWIFDEEFELQNKSKRKTIPNLKNGFIEELEDAYGDAISPIQIFEYIFAILHSNIYRTRYFELLKRSYPRISFTSNINLFKKVCNLGNKLTSLHLLESNALKNHITTYPISGDNAVTKVGEKRKTLADVENGKGKLFINKTQYFDGLPEEVWNFHIGGYQVCHKWLAARKKAGRKLSADDIEHYHKIVVAINETIKIMKQIDEVIAAHGGWPIK